MLEIKSCPVPGCKGEAEVFKVDFAHEDFDRLMCSKCTLECSREAWQMIVREEDTIEKSGATYLWPQFLVKRWIDRVAELKDEIREKLDTIRDLENRLEVYREYSPLRPSKKYPRSAQEVAEAKLLKIKEVIDEK